ERFAEAEPLLAGVRDTVRRLQPNSTDAARAAAWMGKLRIAQGRVPDAEPYLREALAIQEPHLNDWHLFETKSLLGGVLTARERYTDAEPLLLSGYDGLWRLRATIPFEHHSVPGEAGARVLSMYERWGRSDKQAEWRRALQARSEN